MIRFLFLLSIACLSLITPAFAKSFASGADVVLISGMAGDVETEAEYEEIAANLVNWLKTIQPSPASVTILADTNAQWSDDRFPIQKLESRQLALKKFIETRKDNGRPLVCFLWGHGGEQRGNPVFHVKGPRLEPSDLAALKNAWSGQPTYWALAFPRSGAFAKAVIADSTKTMSSENEMVFKSDPLLMQQASRVLRDQPDLSFEEFAKESGKKIDTFYKDNGLARTEDPILWDGMQPPAFLIPKNQEAALADANADVEPPDSDDTDVPQRKRRGSDGASSSASEEAGTSIVEKTRASTDTPSSASEEVWKSIVEVDPKKYPDDDAVVLFRSLKYVLAGKPAVQTETEQFIQILTPEGTTSGDIQLSYAPPAETLELLNCEIRYPGGAVKRIATEGARDASSDKEPGYNMLKKKSFSFPGVKAGCILRLHYRRSWQTFPMPHLFVEANLGLPIPAVKTNVEIRVSKSMAFHYALQGVPDVQPEIETSVYGKQYKWTFDNLPARAAEILSPPGTGVRLMASTFPNWEEFAGWYERLIRLADVPNEAIKAKAADLTAGSKNDLEKVEAIYNYVTALRYVMIPLGVNSHRPHSAENVFANQYGDCKDKANLFNTMLRTVGIEAYLVLVPRFAQADERLPGMSFNHAISQVRLKNQTLWIDTTDPTCRFGMLPPGDPGRKVLVIDGKSRTLDLLPYPDPKSQTMRITGTLDLSDTLEPAGTVRAEPRGYSDYMLRSAAGEWGEKSAFPILDEAFQATNGSYILEHQKMGPVADLAQETWWESSGKWSGLLTDLDDEGKKQIVRAPLWLPKEWSYAGNRRSEDTQLNKGYPLRVEETVTVKLPPGAQMTNFKKSSGELKDLFNWSFEWRAKGDREAEVTFVAELLRGDLSRDETAKFGSELNRMRAAIANGPTLTR